MQAPQHSQSKNFEKYSPTTVSDKSILQVSLKGVFYKSNHFIRCLPKMWQECPVGAFEKCAEAVPVRSVLQEQLPRAFCKSLCQACLARVSYRSLGLESSTSVPSKHVSPDFAVRMSYIQESYTGLSWVPSTVSYKSVQGEMHSGSSLHYPFLGLYLYLCNFT